MESHAAEWTLVQGKSTGVIATVSDTSGYVKGNTAAVAVNALRGEITGAVAGGVIHDGMSAVRAFYPHTLCFS